MTNDQYENAKKDLRDKKWRLENLTGSDSFSQHMRMHISFLEALINKYEDCHHINKPVIKNIEIQIEVLR